MSLSVEHWSNEPGRWFKCQRRASFRIDEPIRLELRPIARIVWVFLSPRAQSMRTCRDMRSSSQSTPNFHPEFGYLCRSGGKRGGLRLAAALVTSAMVLAGSMVLFGLANRSADASDQVSAAATIDEGQGGEVAANSALAA